MPWLRPTIGPVFLALAAAASAQGPVASTTRIESDGSRTLSHTIGIPAPAAQVWTAIATPEGWRTWAVPLARWSATDPDVMETAYDPAAPADGPGTIHQRFLARVPERLLVFRTIKAPAGFPHAEIYYHVTSVFELLPEGAAMRVRLTSTGYPDSDAGRQLLAFFATGNAETLEMLKRRFATGPIDWTTRKR